VYHTTFSGVEVLTVGNCMLNYSGFLISNEIYRMAQNPVKLIAPINGHVQI
jgi:hypothetical protein